MSKAPVLVFSPRDDPEFRELVDQAIAQGADTPLKLQAVLRQRYPQAVARARDLSAEPTVVWYLYRDGRWIRPAGTPGG